MELVLLGIVLMLASLGLVALLLFVIVPKFCLKYSFFKTLKEASMNEDSTICLPDKENVSYVESYNLVLDRANRKHYLRVVFTPEVHKVKFYVVMFDVDHKPIKIRVIDVADGQLENLYDVPLNARGFYIQVMDVDGQQIADHLPVYLKYSQMIVTAIVSGLCTMACSIAFMLGLCMFFYGYDYETFFPGKSKLFLFIVFLVIFIVAAVASYFITLLTHKNYVKEEK